MPAHQTGERLNGRYVIEGVLGEGAMSCVYRVRDGAATAGVWALKEMRIVGQSGSELTQATAMFEQEAAWLSTLKHPGLPRVVDYFTTSEGQYLVMELIPGQTLEDIVEHRGPLTEVQALSIAQQLLSCLDYLHSHRDGPIVFRDLKPSNIMVGPDGLMKLIDFGIARRHQETKKRDTQALGTPGFCAPEQYGLAQSTPRTDLYSFAATLHYVLSGKDPDPDPGGGRFAPLRTLVPTASERLERVLAHCLEPKVEDRPLSAKAVQEALPVAVPPVQGLPSALGSRFLGRWLQGTFACRPGLVTPGRVAGAILLAFICLVMVPNMVSAGRTTEMRQTYECRSNLKNLGTALEMYSTDHEGHYPTQLQALIPDYLRKLPECPHSQKGSYAFGYEVSSSTERFTVTCVGHQHPRSGEVLRHSSIDGISGH